MGQVHALIVTYANVNSFLDDRRNFQVPLPPTHST